MVEMREADHKARDLRERPRHICRDVSGRSEMQSGQPRISVLSFSVALVKLISFVLFPEACRAKAMITVLEKPARFCEYPP